MCLGVPTKHHSRGTPDFCFSRKLQFSVCKASSRVGSMGSGSTLTDVGQSKLRGQKMQYHPPVWTRGLEVALGGLLGHSCCGSRSC